MTHDEPTPHAGARPEPGGGSGTSAGRGSGQGGGSGRCAGRGSGQGGGSGRGAGRGSGQGDGSGTGAGSGSGTGGGPRTGTGPGPNSRTAPGGGSGTGAGRRSRAEPPPWFRRVRVGAGVRDPGVRREARAELPLLACLTLVVALLALVTAAGPPLLDRWAGDALRARFAGARQNDAEIRQTVSLQRNETEPEPDPAHSKLGAALREATATLMGAARKPLSPVLRHDSTRIEVPLERTATGAGRGELGLLYADDAPSAAAYVQGVPPGPATRTSPIPVSFSTGARDVLHLTVGQRLTLSPDVGSFSTDAVVTGFFAPPADRGAPIWHEEVLLERPAVSGGRWRSQALIDPASVDALQSTTRGLGADLTVHWRASVRLDAGQADHFATASGLRQLQDAADSYTADVAKEFCPTSAGLTFNDCEIGGHGVTGLFTDNGVPDLIAPFATAREQARTLESFALAGLIAVGLATVVVTARLAVHRRAAAQALQRARGASATDLALVRLVQTAPAALLGAALGLGAAAWAVPGAGGAGALVPAAVLAAAAWLTLPALTLFATRDRGSRPGRPPAVRRLTVEAGVLLLALAGVLMLRSHGAGGGGLDVGMTVVPALLGAATVVLLIRIYPLPVRLLSRVAAGRRGTVPLIALSRAAREAPGQALALLVLVTTLSTAVFGGLVARTVADGSRTAAVWNSGADASVIGAGRGGTVEPELAGIPGVRHSTVVRDTLSQLTGDSDGARHSTTRIVGLDADAVRKAAPGSPAARALTAAGLAGRAAPPPTGGHYVVPALATRNFAGDLVGTTYTSTLRDGAVSFRIVGVLPDAARRDPALGPLLSVQQQDAGRGESADSPTALATDSPLLLVDAASMSLLGYREISDSAVLLYGPHLDLPSLRSAASRAAGPSGRLRVRSTELAAAADDGLLRGVRRSFTVATALAVLLALVALVLELLLSARDRGRTASRLRTLGLPTRGIAAMNVLELLPMALAAVAGGLALGLALPGILGPTLSLREFTGGPAAPAPHTDYVLTAGLALGLAALMAAAVAAETWAGRRRGLGAVLRLGDAV